MGRIEKKFQKKKERERAVRKKILKKRDAAHVTAKQFAAQDKLERAANKAERKNQPIRNVSPELQKVLEQVNKLADKAFEKEDNPDVDCSDDPPDLWFDSNDGK